jgi:hypothetical protein
MQYLGSFQELTPIKILGSMMPLVFLLLLWSGAWAIANRIVAHRFQPLAHCTAAALLGTGYLLFEEAVDYYAFAFAADRSVTILQWGGVGFVLSAMLYTHMRLCSGDAAPRLGLRSMVAAGAIVSLIAFSTYAVIDDFVEVHFPFYLKPPGFRVVNSRNLDQFVTDTRALQTTIDALVQKARAEDPDGEGPAAPGDDATARPAATPGLGA